MRNEHFESIKAGLEDVVAYMQGDRTRGKTHTIPVLNIKELRHQLGLTQNQLAGVIGATLQTVAAWEQKTNSRYPSGPTQKLLCLLQQRPELVQDLQQMPH
ncbi:MAG: helix-turn-helix domain-containing protein [Cyanobacteria bacterium P01_A01_bin.17]